MLVSRITNFVPCRQCCMQTKLGWVASMEEVAAVPRIPTQRCHWWISTWQGQTSNACPCVETTKDVSLDGNECKFIFVNVLYLW